MHSVERPLLECSGLCKSFSGVRVLRHVSLEARAGELVCVVGENGAGKSTLMNLIGGVHQPDSGEMMFDGQSYRPTKPLDAARAGIAFVHQELNLFPNLTIAENLFVADYPVRSLAGLCFRDNRTARTHCQELLAMVGLDASPDTLVERLPQGDRQLVEIARGLRLQAGLIIFDEPTTSLTTRESERLFAILSRLKQQGIAILYISHALEHVMALADRVVVLRDGAVVCAGPRQEFTAERMIAAMVGRSIEQLYPGRTCKAGEQVVLSIRDLSKRGVLENITFDVRSGEIAGIAGLMGSGRSELARMIFGLDRPERGSVFLNGELLDRMSVRERIRRGMAFVTESRHEDGLLTDGSVEENVCIVHPDASGAITTLARLHVAYASLKQPVAELSGGNQQKVVLGKWLLRTPAVLIADEPTRGIDVGAKEEIYRLLAELADSGMAVLMISSELEELMGMCERIFAMRRGEITAEFPAGSSREQIMKAAI